MTKAKLLTEYADVLIPQDLVEILHVSSSTVYKNLANGIIKSLRIGNQYRIPKMYLIDYLYPSKDSSSGKGV